MLEGKKLTLTSDHLRACNAVLDNCGAAREIIEKCKNCGLDMSAYEAQLAQHHEMASKIKQQFFPGTI